MWNPPAALRRHRTPPRPGLGRARGHAGALVAAWQRNGIWAPGILLMRDLSLRAKGLVLSAVIIATLAVLMLPQAWRAIKDFNQQATAQAAVGATQAAVALEHALQAAGRARVAGPLAPDRSASAAQSGRAALAALDAALHSNGAWSAPASTRSAWDELLRRQQAAPHADAGQAHSERLIAARTLRNVLVARWLPEIDRDGGGHGLAGVDPRTLLEAADLVHRVQIESAPLLQAGAADSPAVLELALEARARLAVAEPQLEQLVRQGALERAEVGAAWREAQGWLESAARLARQPAQWAADPVGDGGSPAHLFQARGERAARGLAGLSHHTLQAMADCLATHRQQALQRIVWMAGASLVSVLVCCYLLIATFQVMAGGVRTLRQHCANLAEGDLSGRPRGWGRDEIGESLNALGVTTGRMAQLLGAMTQGVSAVSHASREVANGNAGLSGRSADIRQAIGEVRERTEGLSQSLEASASGVGEAAQHVRTMRLNAQRSHKAVSTLRGHMRSLRNKSREVTHVVGLVESVAHQTKLLSLNASVEASRAGPAGKSFSIVAQEVRALALRTEEAARRIQTIIGSSVDEIQEGNLVADRASEAVDATDASIEAVNELMGDVVSLASSAMSEAQEVLGITLAVEESVSGSVRAVDQLQRASSALREQGDSLKLSVQHFVLE